MVESIVINVLSKNISPTEIVERIDEFLRRFRRIHLTDSPQSTIDDHASSLAERMRKPVSKLGVESRTHFGKILRYVPEVLASANDTNNEYDADVERVVYGGMTVEESQVGLG